MIERCTYDARIERNIYTHTYTHLVAGRQSTVQRAHVCICLSPQADMLKLLLGARGEPMTDDELTKMLMYAADERGRVYYVSSVSTARTQGRTRNAKGTARTDAPVGHHTVSEQGIYLHGHGCAHGHTCPRGGVDLCAAVLRIVVSTDGAGLSIASSLHGHAQTC